MSLFLPEEPITGSRESDLIMLRDIVKRMPKSQNLNGYSLFVAKTTSRFPDIPIVKRMQMIADMWRELDQPSKSRLGLKAKVLKEQNKLAMEAFEESLDNQGIRILKNYRKIKSKIRVRKRLEKRKQNRPKDSDESSDELDDSHAES